MTTKRFYCNNCIIEFQRYSNGNSFKIIVKDNNDDKTIESNMLTPQSYHYFNTLTIDKYNSFNSLNFEKQTLNYCGKHALNNLLQLSDNKYTIEELDKISLKLNNDEQSIFNNDMNISNYVYGIGNYNIQVLLKALTERNYDYKQYNLHDIKKINIDEPQSFLLCSYKHYYAIRKFNSLPGWIIFDSTNDSVLIINNIIEYLADIIYKPNSAVIRVYLEKHENCCASCFYNNSSKLHPIEYYINSYMFQPFRIYDDYHNFN